MVTTGIQNTGRILMVARDFFGFGCELLFSFDSIILTRGAILERIPYSMADFISEKRDLFDSP